MSTWFPDTIGHPLAKQALQRGVTSGRLTGSLLLCGPSGTGRSLLARELAQAVNCLGDPSGPQVPCGACEPCRKIKAGLSGDYVVVQPTDRPSIGIKAIRAVLDDMALAPVECRRRVFVINPASALKEDAQNALLKRLEEPPPNTLIILLVEHEREVLSTITSRCRVVRIQGLPLGEVEQILLAAGLPPKDASERARWSCGSPGLALADDAPAVNGVAADTLEAFASGEAYDDPMQASDALLSFADGAKSEGAQGKRDRIAKAIRIIVRALRDAMATREGHTQERISGAEDALLARLAALPAGRLERAVDLIVQVEEELSRNANTKFVLDGLVLDAGSALAPTR